MANGRGDDFTPLVRLMRTINSIHYPTRFAQVFFSKKPKKFPRTHTAGFSVGRAALSPPSPPDADVKNCVLVPRQSGGMRSCRPTGALHLLSVPTVTDGGVRAPRPTALFVP